MIIDEQDDYVSYSGYSIFLNDVNIDRYLEGMESKYENYKPFTKCVYSLQFDDINTQFDFNFN